MKLYLVPLALITLVFINISGIATASQPYWIDSDKNLWLNMSLNGETQTIYVSNMPGYAPDANAVMWAHDNFSSGTLDSSKWTASKMGSSSSIAGVYNKKLVLAGQYGAISSGIAVLNKSFTNGNEIIINQALGTSNGDYSDAAFGSGSITCLDGNGWYHPLFSSGGAMFALNRYSHSPYYIESSALTNFALPITNYLVTPSTYVTPTTSHTVAYGYDKNGQAYMDLLNVTGNHQGLNIPDPYGYGQFVHPSVIYNEGGIFGHKYWMLITPYAGTDSSLENPCLYYSDDGIDWFVPPNVNNPIDSFPGSEGYNSDPELIYDSSSNKLMCYYEELINANNTDVTKLRTYDGNVLSDEINVGSPNGASPAVLKVDGKYYMWIVDWKVEPHVLYRYDSTDGINWVNKTTISAPVTNRNIWHLDVLKRDGDSKIYGLITYCDPNSNSGLNTDVYIATANNIFSNFTVQSTPLLKVGVSPDLGVNFEFYKVTGTFISNSDSDGMKIWYSSVNWPYYRYGPIDGNGGWATEFTEIKPTNGIWAVKNYNIPRAHIMSYKNTAYLNNQKQWMLSEGDDGYYNHGLNRTINLVYGYKTGHDPSVSVANYGTYKKLTITPADSQNVQDYQVKIPANLLSLSSQQDSLYIGPTSPGNTPPVINSVLVFPNNTTTGSLINISVVATDSDGVISVNANGIALSNQGGNTWNGSIVALEGNHSVNVSAADGAGNVAWNNSTSYKAITPSVNTAPVISSVIVFPNNTTTGSLINVSVVATDSDGVISVNANSIELSNQGGDTWSGSIVALEGNNSVNVSAADGAGNVAWNNSTSYTAITPDNPGNSTIYGYSFNDLNGNKQMDTGEVGLSSRTINLNGYDTLKDVLINTATSTNSTGYFEFTGVNSGVYVVSQSFTIGWIPTTEAAYTLTVSGNSTIEKDFGNRGFVK